MARKFPMRLVITLLGGALLTASLNADYARRVKDVDGDGLADPVVFRPRTSSFYVLSSKTGYASALTYQLGEPTDTAAAADYDGDGKIDFAVWRDRTASWFVLLSSQNYTAVWAVAFGLSGDTPVPADYDNDGLADIATYRPSNGTWNILTSKSNFTKSFSVSWGISTSIPVPGDYDGDGKIDIASYVPPAVDRAAVDQGTWYVLQGGLNFTTAFARQIGGVGGILVPADYDFDGTTDMAYYDQTTSTFYILLSSAKFNSAISKQWGVPGDQPAVGDFDGDGKVDIGVYRGGTWYILRGSSGYTSAYSRTLAGGTIFDVPVFMP